MRPRHKAAENADLSLPVTQLESLASMRPRHKAAENDTGLIQLYEAGTLQ